jgi:hypothetical protein
LEGRRIMESFLKERIEELKAEMEGLDINDSLNDYLEGAIDAYQIVLGKING